MKKFILLLLALLILVPVIGLTSCGECEHTWADATCTAPKTCTQCQATEGAALGHTFGEWNTVVEANCTIEGSKARTCQICGTLETGVIETNNNHTSETIPAVAPTCVATGSTAGTKCSDCNEILAAPQTIPATGKHNYSVRYQSTSEGHYQVCLVCNHEGIIQAHVDENKDGICDVCKGTGEDIPVFHTVTIKTEFGGHMVDVATILVANNTAMNAEQLAELYASRYLGFGFETWAYENGTAFDDKAVITGPVTIVGARGDLAGEKITWSYSEADQTLNLTGEGDMFDFANITAVPWNGLTIKKAVIDTRITSIGSYSFYVDGASSTGMKLNSNGITLHEGITKIGKYAFYGETSINKMIFPTTLKVIDENAFRNCTSLTSLDIGNENLERVNDSAFAQCTALQYIIFNDAIEKSGNVFEGCNFSRAFFTGNKGQFEALEIGFGNKCLHSAYMFFYSEQEPSKAGPYWHFAFDEKTQKDLPTQWSYILHFKAKDKDKTHFTEDYVSVKGGKLTQENIDFANNIWFEGYQFESWSGSVDLRVGNTVYSNITYTGVRGSKVGDSASYTLNGNTLTITGSGKMWDFESANSAPWVAAGTAYSAVTTIKIDPTITYIGKYAFCNMQNLVAVNIDTNIVEMHPQAFAACDNLRYVYYNGNEFEALNCKGLNELTNSPETKVYYKEFEDFGKLSEWGIEELSIHYWKDIVISEKVTERITWEYEDGVLTIGGSSLIPDVSDPTKTPWAITFSAIAATGAFDLESIDVAVKNIVVREGITEIGDNAFNGLTAAENIQLPASVEIVSGTAFTGTAFIADENKYDDAGLLILNNILIKVNANKASTRVLLPTSLIAVADGAFDGCSAVTEIRIPRGLSGVTAASFSGLSGLKTVFFHAGAKDWEKSPCNGTLPETAKVYFFSNNDPGSCGYFWGNLTNPTIYENWIPETVHATCTPIQYIFLQPTCKTDGKAYKAACPYCHEPFADKTEITIPMGNEYHKWSVNNDKIICETCKKQCSHNKDFDMDGNCDECKLCIHKDLDSDKKCDTCKEPLI